MAKSNESEIKNLPNGSLILYRGHLYFVSDGLEARIVTGEDGMWYFIHNLRWKKYKIIHRPKTSGPIRVRKITEIPLGG